MISKNLQTKRYVWHKVIYNSDLFSGHSLPSCEDGGRLAVTRQLSDSSAWKASSQLSGRPPDNTCAKQIEGLAVSLQRVFL